MTSRNVMGNRNVVTILDNASGERIECGVLEGVHGRPVVDIRGLPSKLGYFAYDPGFASTASCYRAPRPLEQRRSG